MNEIEELYRCYLEKVNKLESERRPADGLFGIGKSPADDPCHDQFAEELETMLNRFTAQSPEHGEIMKVLAFIYRMPQEHREPVSAYWMMNAVHGLTMKLIGMLARDEAEQIMKEYINAYPKAMRLPVQKKVCIALEEAASGK